jgi:hypothetical protein
LRQRLARAEAYYNLNYITHRSEQGIRTLDACEGHPGPSLAHQTRRVSPCVPAKGGLTSICLTNTLREQSLRKRIRQPVPASEEAALRIE